MRPPLEGWPAKAEEAPSPHELRLAPIFQSQWSLRRTWEWMNKYVACFSRPFNAWSYVLYQTWSLVWTDNSFWPSAVSPVISLEKRFFNAIIVRHTITSIKDDNLEPLTLDRWFLSGFAASWSFRGTGGGGEGSDRVPLIFFSQWRKLKSILCGNRRSPSVRTHSKELPVSQAWETLL